MENCHYCKSCNYSTSRLFCYNRHIKTKKHLQKNSAPFNDSLKLTETHRDQFKSEKNNEILCKYCKLEFRRNWNKTRHEKKCIESEMDMLRELNKKYEVLLIILFLVFLLFLVSEGLLFVSFFWTSFHSLSSSSLGICSSGPVD